MSKPIGLNLSKPVFLNDHMKIAYINMTEVHFGRLSMTS